MVVVTNKVVLMVQADKLVLFNLKILMVYLKNLLERHLFRIMQHHFVAFMVEHILENATKKLELVLTVVKWGIWLETVQRDVVLLTLKMLRSKQKAKDLGIGIHHD